MFEIHQLIGSRDPISSFSQKGDAHVELYDRTEGKFIKSELSKLSATDIYYLVQKDYITVREYASCLLQRVRERDPLIQAWVYLDEDHVLKQAEELDALPHEQRGPLHGVAIGIKDVALTKGNSIGGN